ncbi:MAG TPA: hypothetical protein PKE27_13980 [Povalibacter sp.]|uniref:hypothetical protein n=1 Tax=Povalibacter sp. TaxID=1962978 RepID=UPI002BB7E18B|nr:hypothetical protein [Povalibacter sp.]HMN45685.1 hypothetical protein [Povalibacter sp.]
MDIIATIQEALRIGRAHKSLWLFGLWVGFGTLGGGGRGGDSAQAPVAVAPPEPGIVLPLVFIGLAVIIGLVILKFVSTGALIEGVKRARRNASLTVREGFREGWAHCGVLFRIAVLYFVANLVSVVLLAGPAVLAGRLFGDGPTHFIAVALAVIVGVPWLVTLYLWRAFAERIAVFENRQAMDAIRKARLFLHGRVRLGLKLLVASFLGVLFIGVTGLAIGVPVVALLVASSALWGVIGAVALGVPTLLPVFFIVIALIGIMTSSVWTIGYLTQVES